MNIEGYREHLLKQGVPSEKIERQVAMIEEMVSFLSLSQAEETSVTAMKERVDRFARKLIVEKRNTLEDFASLCDYANWIDHRQLYVALIELMDCHNAMTVLAEKIDERHSRATFDQIFREALPPLGASEVERCAHTRMIMGRMAQQIEPGAIRAAWFEVQHGLPATFWHESDMAEQEKYRQCGSVDEFLDLKRRERNTMLTHLRDEGALWYTIEIDDEVLEFITSDPEMEGGRREGNKIYITKVPYKASQYLHETDPKMKRYYACHCPLVREAILRDQPVSPDICECSLGNASHYLAGLGQKLKGEVLESAVKGDSRCRFVFCLPEHDDETGT